MNIEEIHKVFLQCTGVCTDTRKIEEGNMFFSLKGPSFNGNEFAESALKSGCDYTVIDEHEYNKGENYILVKDVLQTLQDLSQYHRRKLNPIVLGITGSNGKTTTKELLYSILNQKYKTLATEGNFNNHIGVPLTLLKIKEEHEVAIIEMGANHVGEIDDLCEIAEPTLALITNIGKAHIGEFGSFENIVKAKMELFDYVLENDGNIFVNADDPVLIEKTLDSKRLLYGSKKSNEIFGEVIEDDELLEVRISNPNIPSIKTQLFGRYNFSNIIAAVAVGHFLDLSKEEIRVGLEKYVPANNRSQVLKTAKNTLILDAYNANPSSMMAALENFLQAKGENKLVILGDMLELGEESKIEHSDVVEWVNENNLEGFFIGEHFASLENNTRSILNVDELISSELLQNIENRTILIKGSRGIRLEKLKEVL